MCHGANLAAEWDKLGDGTAILRNERNHGRREIDLFSSEKKVSPKFARFS